MATNRLTWWNGKKEKQTFTYEGIKNNKKTKYQKFIKICKKEQMELKSYLVDVLSSAGYKPIVGDGYIFAKGTNTPVLLTAHMDTVHKEAVKDFYEETRDDGTHVISSPQGIGGDDRCGIYMIHKIITATELRPTILFCEDEEIGGIGSCKFCETKYASEMKDMKFLVELDRANADDAVFYECDNPDFTDFILDETGFKENWGSFSDIGNLSPISGVASVNLSCGYYNAHTLGEYVVMEEMENTIEILEKLLRKAQREDIPAFEYIEQEYTGKYWDDWGYGYGYGKELTTYTILWDQDGDELQVSYDADCEEFAMYQFFFDNPTVCFNDVLACYKEWSYEKNYASN